MKTQSDLLLLMLLLMVAPAQSQIDPEQDIIGLYFDVGATEFCRENVPSGAPFSVYLCITNESSLSGVRCWAATVEVPPDVFILQANHYGNPVPVQTPYGPALCLANGMGLPWTPSIVLSELLMLTIDPGEKLFFVLPSFTEPFGPFGCILPAYTSNDAPDTWVTLGYPLGWDPETCFPYPATLINPPEGCPPPVIPTTEATWGTIKTMYR